ncbi:MAG: hypothetical protein KDD97_14780 [Rhodobacteraceae bacterium]|jgi:hypothetical protein|uniref:hypothetical protein n=1 Tax=Albidovulum sp. TaxID=1872424 RepID=UPI001DBE3219|nr:hypothetical protein [uncultured Defluviimonas sp.]MCB2126824.1 hypothetical protein [Paracoccaceae bacterium]
MSRVPEYYRGFRDGIAWAIACVEAEAERMNDPHARGVLHSMAFTLGTGPERREAERSAWRRSRPCPGAKGFEDPDGSGMR